MKRFQELSLATLILVAPRMSDWLAVGLALFMLVAIAWRAWRGE